MCGRTAQTQFAVGAAAEVLAAAAQQSNTTTTASSFSSTIPEASDSHRADNNYNLSPGMDAVCFWKDVETGAIQQGRKVWGLVPKGGTASNPLQEGMSQHFSNLMFNARSDTLYAKPTFGRLANAGKTCLVAVDGFFEWKTTLGQKQPYFVYRKKSLAGNETSSGRPYLLLAGLWTKVPTGRGDDLDTFTLLTTEVCDPLKWLHSRMPVCVWDEALALDWLTKPTQSIHEALALASRQTGENVVQWHAVTPKMSSVKFRDMQAVVKLPKLKTVKSFFSPKKPSPADSQDPIKDGKEQQPHHTPSQATPREPRTPTTGKRNRSSPELDSPRHTVSKQKKSTPCKIEHFFKPAK